MTKASNRRSAPQRAYAGKSAEQRRAERRGRFLAAGLELFGTGGYATASVDRMCEVAGLSSRQFYAEFDNRDDLLITLYDQINERAENAVREVLADGLADGVHLRLMVRYALTAYIDAISRDSRRAMVAFNAVVGVNPRVESHRRRRRARWVDNLVGFAALAADRGMVPAQDVRLTMTAFIGAVNGLVHDWSAGENEASREEVADTLAHVLYSALVTPSDPKPE